jgi:hypothetical protein
MDMGYWSEQIASFSGTRKAIAFNLRGMGQPCAGGEQYALADLNMRSSSINRSLERLLSSDLRSFDGRRHRAARC